MRRAAPWTSLALLIFLGTGALFLTSHLLRPRPIARPAAPMQQEPLTILWAWETPEDLTPLDPNRTGVAFLARSIYLTPTPIVRPRRQPLTVAPNTWLMAVVRIETQSQTPPNTAALRSQLLADILPAAQLPNVRALQIDFDATTSQRTLYTDLLHDLRRQLPPSMPLSITALVSWCGPQSWLATLPSHTIDEAVPMFFRMGGTPTLRATLPKNAAAVTQPLCASSAGVATDETWPQLHSHQRVYIFRSGPWTKLDLGRLNAHGPAALTSPPQPPEPSR
jgi:hypothetical protein